MPDFFYNKNNKEFSLPMFLPVYQPGSNLISVERMISSFPVKGMIMNGFFLYKNAESKQRLLSGTDLHNFVGFDGLIMTDSGAFQGLSRPLYLSNKKIVAFQDSIGADIISPLDLISPPGDNYSTAQKKLNTTLKRIVEAKKITKNSILAGVQQGGKHIELRKYSTEELMKIGIDYLAIGSLVPFFNKNHDLTLVIKILRETRKISGNSIPVHVYGSGDPVEMPFIAYLGTDIFDSSSYAHYALSGWYMTKFGALKSDAKEKIIEYNCDCEVCKDKNYSAVFKDSSKLAFHNLFQIFSIIDIIANAQKQNQFENLLDEILAKHSSWFPESALKKSWEENIKN